jgi:hypothetical protein
VPSVASNDAKRASGEVHIGERWGSLAIGLIPIGLYLIAVPLTDLLTRAYPLNVHNLQWRFGLMGIAFTNLGTIVLGFLMLVLAAAVRGHGTLLRIISVLSFVSGVFVLVTLGLYMLDAVQLRQAAPAAVKIVVVKAGLTAGVASLTGAAGLLGLGVAGWRMSSRRRASGVQGEGPGNLYFNKAKGG